MKNSATSHTIDTTGNVAFNRKAARVIKYAKEAISLRIITKSEYHHYIILANLLSPDDAFDLGSNIFDKICQHKDKLLLKLTIQKNRNERLAMGYQRPSIP